jgi:uncharacterized protein with PIN domain
MVASKRRSKKRSGASSARRLEATLTYFVDECLGRHFVADALRDAGAHVEVHHEHFPSGALDADWLSIVGERKWIVLTKDRHIRRRALEVQAIVNARVRAFVLTAADLTGPEQAVAFVRALRKMNRIASASPGPLIGRVGESGGVSILPLPSSRSKKR